VDEFVKRDEATFIRESEEESSHFPGSHWEPFFDNTDEVFEMLPGIMPEALPMTGFSDDHDTVHSPYPPEPDFPDGFYLSWPLRKLGLVAALRMVGDANHIESLFPYAGRGSEHTLTLERVHVWPGGLEAQIEASLDGATIEFFDCMFVRNRDWYSTDDRYQFILTGIAYDAKIAEDHVFQVEHKPEILEALQKHAEEHGYEPPDEVEEFHTKGMTALLPVSEGDRDDHLFQGIVRSVKEIEMLEQPGWMARTTVIRDLSDDGNKTFDLDILITQKVWKEKQAPTAGIEIEGTLWLQGYLWYPHQWHVPDYER